MNNKKPHGVRRAKEIIFGL